MTAGSVCPTVPSPPSFFTKVLNQTAMQVYWELPSKPGKLEGFRLEYRSVSNPEVQGQEAFPAHINTHTISHLGEYEAGVYRQPDRKWIQRCDNLFVYFLQSRRPFTKSSWWRLTGTETVRPTAALYLWQRERELQQVGA